MPYASNRTYRDADSHIMETVDWVERHADPEVREKLPQMSLVASGAKSFDIINEAGRDERVVHSAINRRGSKDSQLK